MISVLKIMRDSRVARSAIVVLAASGALACMDNQPGKPSRPPHIVFILIDTLRAENLSCYGYDRQTSPTLDSLAENGVLFEQAISVGGNTSTAMPAIFTGRLPYFDFGGEWGEAPFGMDRFGTDSDGPIGLPNSMTTMAERLQEHGYHTAGFITNPYLKSVLSMDQGFDHYTELFKEIGNPYGRGDELTDLAITYLEDVDFSEPVFLYLHFMDVHGPYMRPEKGSMYSDGRPQSQRDHSAMWGEWMTTTGDISGRRAELRSYMIDAYDTSIRFVDGCIAKVFGYLAARELLSDAVVIVTSDHGEEFLEHGKTRHKGPLFDEIVHVPLILKSPSGARGLRISRLVRNFDVMPTVLEVAGIEQTADLEAESLLKILDRPEDDPDRSAYANFPWLRMVRTSRYKLLVRKNGTEMFFDLSTDPGEKENLVGPQGEVDDAVESAAEAARHRMSGVVEMLLAQGGGERRGTQESLDNETRRQLKALGYLK